MRIFLNSLTLTGDSKEYKISFKKGLNFITGPISTGKSTILELVNYCLGKNQHKDYSEVKLKCKYVSLDLLLNGKRYKIERPLFSFDLPVKIYKWNDELQDFENDFSFYNVTIPKNEDSLARFFQEELEIPELKFSGQTFSFRDIFKYCYVSQPKIDSENILDEKNYNIAFKRKPTLEIIFNSLNELLNELKNDKKVIQEIIGEKLERKQAIIEFLREVQLFSSKDENLNKKTSFRVEKINCLNQLNELKDKGKLNDDKTKSLESKLFYYRRRINDLASEEAEAKKYLDKLDLLLNQYSNEIIKIDYLILSNGKLKSIEFNSCPSCNSDIDKTSSENCNLCGNLLTEFDENESKAIKLERKRLNSKLNSLRDYIDTQKIELKDINVKKSKLNINILKLEEKIDEIQRQYISPYLEKIEILNRKIGELDKQIENIEISENVESELKKLSNEIQAEENKLGKIIQQIEEIENDGVDFPVLLNKLSKIFFNILKCFEFPKLNDAYIDQRTYMPFVRGTRYNMLGSLGAVTLINVAYFLSILELSLSLHKSYHPKILMLDTVGKNLGTRDNSDDDEFKDSKIFKAVLKYLVDISKKYENQIQIIVINNDYTSDIKDSDIIAKFDGDGTKGIKYGLIDDVF